MQTDTFDLRTIAPGPELLSAVRALFVRRGTSLNAWCIQHKFTRTWVISALTGRRNGPAAIDMRERVLLEFADVAA